MKKLKTLRELLPDISDWNEKDIINGHHILFGVKNKEGKTLHSYELWRDSDCGDGWNGEYPSSVVRYNLQKLARKWIDYIYKFDRNGKTWNELEGFDRDIDEHYYHRELLIEWIRYFFNLEEEDD